MILKYSSTRLAQLLISGVAILSCLITQGAEIPEGILKSIRERVDSGKTVGIVVGVVDADGVSYFGYGKMAASGNDLPGKDTVFEIGSISKVFTAILLADAVHRGEVNYKDSIQTHLPSDLKMRMKDGKQITLEQLSIQNSGLPRLPSNLKPTDATNS
jgi:serine-type D-Ala-D-Ala carboxypeptidase/endopeptidase